MNIERKCKCCNTIYRFEIVAIDTLLGKVLFSFQNSDGILHLGQLILLENDF